MFVLYVFFLYFCYMLNTHLHTYLKMFLLIKSKEFKGILCEYLRYAIKYIIWFLYIINKMVYTRYFVLMLLALLFPFSFSITLNYFNLFKPWMREYINKSKKLYRKHFVVHRFILIGYTSHAQQFAYAVLLEVHASTVK